MKRKNTAYIVIAISFVLFNIFAFVIPSDKTSGFWITYAFSVIAFAIQAFIWKLSIGNKTDLRSKFFKIPLVQIGVGYISIQLFVFIIFKMCSFIPSWIAVILCSVILSVASIGLITTDAAIDEGLTEVSRIDEKIAVKRQYIKELLVEVEILAEAETDPTVKEKLKAFAKKIRLSDPMSSDRLTDLEESLFNKVLELKTASHDKETFISEAEILLLERNKKCKMLKG